MRCVLVVGYVDDYHGYDFVGQCQPGTANTVSAASKLSVIPYTVIGHYVADVQRKCKHH